MIGASHRASGVRRTSAAPAPGSADAYGVPGPVGNEPDTPLRAGRAGAQAARRPLHTHRRAATFLAARRGVSELCGRE